MAASDPWRQFIPKPPPLTRGQKWHVFLSYRSIHRPWLIQLYDILRHAGYKVFFDQCVMPTGAVLVSSLEEGLEKSASGILVWSTAARDSVWCELEHDAMVLRATTEKNNYHFVAVAVDTAKLPLSLRQRTYVDFSGCPEGPRGVGLFNILYGILGKSLPYRAVRLATAIDEKTRLDLAAVQGARETGDRARLLRLARSKAPAWTSSPLLGAQVAESLIRIKRYEDALAVLRGLEKRFPKAIRPKQLKGLVLAKQGDWRKAQTILGDLEAAGEQDPETLGIYARTWMDRYQQTKNVKHLARSRDLYARAFDNAPNDYYTGINAASKSVLLGEFDQAREYAKRVAKIVGDKKVDGDYWKTATIGEVRLIRGKYAEAAAFYRAAVDMAPEEIDAQDATRLQAERLMAALGTPPPTRARIAAIFKH